MWMPATREHSQLFLNVFKSIDLEIFQALPGTGKIRHEGLIVLQAPALRITLEQREVGISSI